ncbi:hypothetical protein HDV05_007817 [Chytridiales sp. JEL 0842]|nr:hypothetical protein HDV05_007817 [Chytridiales sp. JEL 0842]
MDADLFGDFSDDDEIRVEDNDQKEAEDVQETSDRGEEPDNNSETNEVQEAPDEVDDDENDDQDVMSEDGQGYRKETVEVKEIVRPLALPSLVKPDENLYLAKLPTFLSADPKPFNRDGFAKDSGLDELEEGSNIEHLKLQLENTIRWRYKDDKSQGKDSNARLIRWSDNTFSLQLGDEMFDVAVKSMHQDHQYLAALHEKESAMQIQTHFSNMMMFKPVGTNSLTHRKLTMAIARKHKKDVRTKVYAKLHDPEQLKKEAEKLERESMKADKKLQATRRKTSSAYPRGDRGEDSEDEINDTAGSSRYRREDRYDDEDGFIENDEDGYSGVSSDQEDIAKEERLRQSKKRPAERVVADYDSDDDDESPIEKESSQRPNKRRIVDSDDDEE